MTYNELIELLSRDGINSRKQIKDFFTKASAMDLMKFEMTLHSEIVKRKEEHDGQIYRNNR